MDVQEMEITINKNGQVEVHVRGVKGDACLQLTKELEAALGGQVILREMTPEAGQPAGEPVERRLDLKGN
jgi:hypothetical protein